MAFLREAEDFLARLPSISLDGMDPLLPQSDPALTKSQYTEMLPTKADLASQKCTITTGPQPFPPFDPTSHLKMGVTKSSATNYSPNSTLYPLSSLESYSATEGGPDQTAVDQRESLQERNISLASCESEAAEEWGLRRSPRNGGSRKSNAPREKRKVGRPIAYCGDPDSPDLTPAERRRIKRRIANRESARRVRARRQDLIEEMAIKAEEMEKHNSTLASHASAIEGQHTAMLQQMAEYNARLQATAAQNDALQREIAQLRALVENKGEVGYTSDHTCPSSSSQCAPQQEQPVNHCTAPHYPGASSSGHGTAETLNGLSFSNGMRSAFASHASLPAEGEANNCQGRLQDMPMCSAASMDQLLPSMGLTPSMAFPWDTTFASDKAPSFVLPVEIF
ncbi:probable Ocs element-binding factor 1 at C-terminar half [Coccomyxa sp. Obi]|nr:probable Ocs element-binding factor 1 at C-terminar half [Coccomyxa sp. Obi]